MTETHNSKSHLDSRRPRRILKQLAIVLLCDLRLFVLRVQVRVVATLRVAVDGARIVVDEIGNDDGGSRLSGLASLDEFDDVLASRIRLRTPEM